MRVASVRTRIQLGVFVLTLAGVAAVCIMIAGDDVSFFRQSESYTARFSNTGGLVEGAPVRMGGVEIGRVESIAIEGNGAEGEAPAVVATLRIDSPYYDMIRSDAAVGLETQGVLGDKFVSLSPGEDKKALPPDSQIVTKEDQGLAKVVEKSTDIVESVASTTKKIDAFAAGLPDADALEKVIKDMTASAAAVRAMIAKLNDDESVVSALRDPASAAALRNGMRHFESTAAHAESIARKIDEGQGTLGALVNDRTLYEDLRAMLGKADRGRAARGVFREATGADGESD